VTTNQHIAAGDKVVRIKGRPSDIGRSGTVVRVCPDVPGCLGDLLVVVRDDDGAEWTAYDRQIKARA
jgi:hypothetical protein